MRGDMHGEPRAAPLRAIGKSYWLGMTTCDRVIPSSFLMRVASAVIEGVGTSLPASRAATAAGPL